MMRAMNGGSTVRHVPRIVRQEREALSGVQIRQLAFAANLGLWAALAWGIAVAAGLTP